MDKSWMNLHPNSEGYRRGLEAFLDFAFENSSSSGKILCPCKNCSNCRWQTREECRIHLICDGFLKNYTYWIFHGEDHVPTNPDQYFGDYSYGVQGEQHTIGGDMEGLLDDAFGFSDAFSLNDEVLQNDIYVGSDEPNHVAGDLGREAPSDGIDKRRPIEYIKLMEDAEKELFPGCSSFSKLSFLVHLMHIKCMKGWDKESFEMTLRLCTDLQPGIDLPKTYYECKKIINNLGLGYKKIHACPKDCMLYWGERANQEVCHVCGTSRWLGGADSEGENLQEILDEKKKKIPVKVLRYFPLIPRLQRLFMSSKTADDMRWHEESRVKDGLLRHPADGEAWKAFDARYPDFATKVRNVRLGLSSDGFNPFRTMMTNYSTWPVVLVPYNLPPWIGMKQSSFILSMIVPGKRSPGNDIDVFLQPLVEELNQLWRGVETYDASKQENFKMRAALMWTVSDFPAYAMLSGWSTKGRFACPNCADKISSVWLSKGRKFCYMCHRRWLPEDHPFRCQEKEFDNTEEHRPGPTCQTGESVLEQVEKLLFTFGKKEKKKKDINRRQPATTVTNKMQRLRVSTAKRQHKTKRGKQMSKAATMKRKRGKKRNHRQKKPAKEPKETDPMKWWKKKSIFFNLPYWKYNLLRHNLDVMHIEKNVCDMLIALLLNTKKSKDNLNARRDLEEMNIKHELHPKPLPNGKFLLPATLFTIDKSEKKTFCKVIRDIKIPDGYASNISRCVNMEELKFTGLKSHDCHVLIEEILPLALQSCSPSNQVLSIVIELATFFKALCSKVINVAELDKIQEMLVVTLCKMETYFIPSFFTIMVHLTIHLISEVKLGGPVHYRWMYPFERYFVRLKSYVRNRACPEGSIAEGYVADECLTFCSRYLEGVNTRFNRPKRNPIPSEEKQDMYLFESAGEIIGRVLNIDLDNKSLAQAHRYVLRHCDEIENFRKEFIDLEKQKNSRLSQQQINKLVDKNVGQWFQNKAMQLSNTNLPKRIWALARGPNHFAKRFSGYIINGWRFHSKMREIGKRSQNSGVVNISEVGEVNYYGRINDMLEIDYYGDFKVVLFKCDWVNVHHKKGMKLDTFGHTFVNFNHLIETCAKWSDDPFVFASQVEQIFYVTDPTDTNWSLEVRTKPRDYFNMGKHLDASLPTYPTENLSETGEPLCLVRSDLDGEEVEDEIDPNKK